MSDKSEWRRLIQDGAHNPEDLKPWLVLDAEELEAVTRRYPMRINAYFLRLMLDQGLPLIRQVVPHVLELNEDGLEDPLAEERDSPVPLLTHRYPDRVLFTISLECAVYCRFCTRKRKVGFLSEVTETAIQEAIAYIRSERRIKDVLLSGGDPLMLSDERLEWILSQIRGIRHVEIIRIGSRMPCVLPHRITPELIEILKQFSPLYINTHFNHPAEITHESEQACLALSSAGFPLGNQTVLLRGINDNIRVLRSLMRGLLRIRVKPYYLHQADLARGTDHFRTSLAAGLKLMDGMRGHISGMAVPTYVLDLPGGGGKIPLIPGYALNRDGSFRNYKGDLFSYPDPICEKNNLAWPDLKVKALKSLP